MRREIAVAAALVGVCVASCGFEVASNSGMDGGLVDDAPQDLVVEFASESSLYDEVSGTVRIPVVLSAPPLDTVTVTFAVIGGTATEGEDFTIVTPTRTLTFTEGDATQVIELAIVDDMVAEPDETIELELSSPIGARLGTSRHTLAISADPLPRVSVRMSKAGDNENKTANVVFELDTASSAEVSVSFVVGGSAGPEDRQLESGSVTFAPGETRKELPLGVIDDALDEDDETVEVTLQAAVGALLASDPATASYTIVDNDPMPAARFRGPDTMTVAEGATTVTFEVELTAVSGRTVTVPFSVAASSTATLGEDYTIAPSPLTFPAGTTIQPIAITLVDDNAPEYDETVTLELGMPTNAELGTPSTRTRTLTITDDDPWCGGSGTFQVCYLQLPSSERSLPTTLNTDTSSLCHSSQPMGWAGQGQPAACVVIGTNLYVSNTTRVAGSRPLVLFARESIVVAGTLDASSKKSGSRGAASPASTCNAPVLAPGVGGGGAGGSFMTLGGDGGMGNDGSPGGRSANTSTPPTVLRAGCDGQSGDGNTENVGYGGGAVYLVANGTLTIHGAINVSGSAGKGGEDGTGGNGGGSGGMIVLHAPAIDAVGGRLVANGGGGASGGGSNQDGVDGSDPDVAMPLVSASGGAAMARSGGRGFATGSPATAGEGDTAADTGGGGGGGGGGYIRSSAALTGAQVSAGRVDAP